MYCEYFQRAGWLLWVPPNIALLSVGWPFDDVILERHIACSKRWHALISFCSADVWSLLLIHPMMGWSWVYFGCVSTKVGMFIVAMLMWRNLQTVWGQREWMHCTGCMLVNTVCRRPAINWNVSKRHESFCTVCDWDLICWNTCMMWVNPCLTHMLTSGRPPCMDNACTTAFGLFLLCPIPPSKMSSTWPCSLLHCSLVSYVAVSGYLMAGMNTWLCLIVISFAKKLHWENIIPMILHCFFE